MKYFSYFLQYLFTTISFLIFKILGPNLSSNLSGKIFQIIGPFFRSKKIIDSNIKKAFPDIDPKNLKKLVNLMWNNYGRVFAEFMFMKEFRYGKLVNKIEIDGENILNEIKSSNQQAIFISGHLSNF